MKTVKEFGETLTHSEIIGSLEVSRGFAYISMLVHHMTCCWCLVLWLSGLGTCWNVPVPVQEARISALQGLVTLMLYLHLPFAGLQSPPRRTQVS